MNDKFLKAATKAQIRVRSWKDTTIDAMQRRADKGQSAVEYMGIIVVVVAIIMVIINTNFGDKIKGEIEEQINKITAN